VLLHAMRANNSQIPLDGPDQTLSGRVLSGRARVVEFGSNDTMNDRSTRIARLKALVINIYRTLLHGPALC